MLWLPLFQVATSSYWKITARKNSGLALLLPIPVPIPEITMAGIPSLRSFWTLSEGFPKVVATSRPESGFKSTNQLRTTPTRSSLIKVGLIILVKFAVIDQLFIMSEKVPPVRQAGLTLNFAAVFGFGGSVQAPE